eukprot:NODE_3365_length_565_cov_51.149225_g2839_i0.p1 GENE.NODE_3365_length_565_cov_51.149225_g2839_i0~~NODE_3365_length_565_cov_51.149225_g2839_i0.p1  ORF type:complete len:168 (+),score=30.26 NODE_3365_length_565_cov_51.149225_g2839_i0:60-563(+)
MTPPLPPVLVVWLVVLSPFCRACPPAPPPPAPAAGGLVFSPSAGLATRGSSITVSSTNAAFICYQVGPTGAAGAVGCSSSTCTSGIKAVGASVGVLVAYDGCCVCVWVRFEDAVFWFRRSLTHHLSEHPSFGTTYQSALITSPLVTYYSSHITHHASRITHHPCTLR